MARRANRYQEIDARLDRMSEALDRLIADGAERARREAELDRKRALWEEQHARWKAEEEVGMRALRAEIDRASKEVERIGNSVGYFAEGLIAPSLRKLLPRVGIRVAGYEQRVERHKNGDTLEIDIVADGRRSRSHEPVVVLVEVSAKLSPEEVNACLKKVPRFHQFHPAYRGHEVVAGVAGMNVPPKVALYAERQGLLVFGPGEEIARLLNRPGFRPLVFLPGCRRP